MRKVIHVPDEFYWPFNNFHEDWKNLMRKHGGLEVEIKGAAEMHYENNCGSIDGYCFKPIYEPANENTSRWVPAEWIDE